MTQDEFINSIVNDIKIIAIDGRSASGKTSLAGRLENEMGAEIIHTDDFFLPSELRTPERFSVPGNNIHYERFISEVILGLKTGRDFSFGCFDCSQMKITKEIKIKAGGLIVIEGAYSMHPAFGAYWDLSVFSDISPELQMQRIIKRNGSEKAEIFRTKWIPMEENYISTCRIKEKADIILTP